MNKTNMTVNVRNLVQSAVIAASYAAVTFLFAPLASGVIQLRVSEAMTVLPFFVGSAVPGLTIGCIIANLIIGAPLDAIFGSMATLMGAIGTYILGKRYRGKHSSFVCLLPPIIANTLIIPFVLAYVYCYSGGILFFFATVAAGEIISAGLLGGILLKVLMKLNIIK